MSDIPGNEPQRSMYVVGLMADRHDTKMMIDAIERQIEMLRRRIYAPQELRELQAELDLESTQLARYNQLLREVEALSV